MLRPLLLLLLLTVSLRCSDTVIDPFDNDERYFTIYGYLDALETRHSVRVVPITRRAENIQTDDGGRGSIDARVYLVDTVTGTRTEWNHSLERLDDGNFGHIFRGDERLVLRRTYRLEVVRSDGVVASAETTIPYALDGSAVRTEEVFSADSSSAYLDVFLEGIPNPWGIRAIYQWEGGSVNRRQLFIPYDRSGDKRDGGYSVRLNISEDQDVIRADIAQFRLNGWLSNDARVGLTVMGIQVQLLDEKWDTPDGVFDEEVLAQPGVLSNVENGYGFFGSVGLYAQAWSAAHLSLPLGYDF